MVIWLGFLKALRGLWRWARKPGSWQAILVACALCAVAYGTFGYVGAKRDAQALRVAVAAAEDRATKAEKSVALLAKAAEANTRSINSRNELLELLKEQEVSERAETIKVLEANKEWANQPIPPELLKRLRK